jgi:pilus assembly protein Flp/PilA
MLQYIYTYVMAHLPKSEKGQDLSEYGLLVALIAIIVLVAVTLFGQNLSTFFNNLATTVSSW